MARRAIIAGFLILLGIGVAPIPSPVPANAAGAHQSGGRPSYQHQTSPRRHHRHYNRHVLWAPRYYGSYDTDAADAPPPPPAPREKQVSETRRVCEPQTYTVPASDGGESRVTVIRC